MSSQKTPKPLNTLLLNILSLGLGFFYLGLYRRFLFFYVLNIAFTFIIFQIIGIHFNALISFLAFYIFLTIFVYVYCWKSASKLSFTPLSELQLEKFHKVWIYILIILLPNGLIHFLSDHARFQSFQVPSKSMLPTILPGDRFFVDTSKKTLAHFQRGDIIVFRYPRDPETFYIKRIIGLSGDKIKLKNKSLYINSVPSQTRPLVEKTDVLIKALEQGRFNTKRSLLELETTDHRIYPIIKEKTVSLATMQTESEFQVPEGSFFVIGDNRDRSNDSRFWGSVTEDLIIGMPTYIFLSLDLTEGAPKFRPERSGHTFFSVY